MFAYAANIIPEQVDTPWPAHLNLTFQGQWLEIIPFGMHLYA